MASKLFKTSKWMRESSAQQRQTLLSDVLELSIAKRNYEIHLAGFILRMLENAYRHLQSCMCYM